MPSLVWSYLELALLTALPLAVGVGLARSGVKRERASQLLSIALYACQTPITMFAIWIARIRHEAIALPFLVLIGWLVTMALAFRVSRPLAVAPKRRGAFVATMSMSNHGYSLLGFVAFALFGEAGLAQATYAHFFTLPYTLLLCFPLLRWFGKGRAAFDFKQSLRENVRDPRVFLPLVAMFIGLGLNLGHVERPAVFSTLTRLLIWVGTALCGVAIGLLAKGALLRRYYRENLVSFVYRSTLYPLLYFALAALASLGPLDARVLILYGLVPSGLLANLGAVFFDLDTDLTSSLYLVGTTLFLLVTLPLFAIFAAMH